MWMHHQDLLYRTLNEDIRRFPHSSASCIVDVMKNRKGIYRLTGMVKAAG